MWRWVIKYFFFLMVKMGSNITHPHLKVTHSLNSHFLGEQHLVALRRQKLKLKNPVSNHTVGMMRKRKYELSKSVKCVFISGWNYLCIISVTTWFSHLLLTHIHKLLIERASAPTFKNFPSFHWNCHQLQSHDTCSFFDSDEEAGAVGNHVLKVDCFSDGACGSI